MSLRVLHISYMERIICIFKTAFKFHNIVPGQEWWYRIQITFSVQTKLAAWFGNVPRNLLVNKSSIQLIWSAPDCDCCVLTSPNKPNKGRNCSRVQSNCPKKGKKPRCRSEEKLKHTGTEERRAAEKEILHLSKLIWSLSEWTLTDDPLTIMVEADRRGT